MSRFIVVFSLIFSIFLVPALSVADPLDNWHWRNPLPQGSSLYGIAYGNNMFVAVGSGTIMTSVDGTNWSVRDTDPPAQLNAITFGNDTFVVVGSDGTMLSSQDGVAWYVRDSGVSYDLKGITYGNNTFVAVGPGSTILTSQDAVTWEKRDAGVAGIFKATAYGNNMFMIVGSRDGTIAPGVILAESMDVVLTSPDGIAWTERDPGTWKGFTGLTYGNNIFAAVGRINRGDWEDGVIVTSPDGVTWSEKASGQYGLNGIVYGGQAFVAVGSYYNYMMIGPDNGMIATSADGISWSINSPKIDGADLRAVAYGSNIYVAVGLNGLLLTSSDGSEWTKIDSGSNLWLGGIVFGNDVFVAFGADYTNNTSGKSTILSSTTGSLWTKNDLETQGRITGAVYGNNKFVAVGHYSPSFEGSGDIFTSTDGFAWTRQIHEFPGQLEGIAYGNSTFVTVGHKNVGKKTKSIALTSATGEKWEAGNPEANEYLTGIAYGNNVFVAVGWNGTILTSSNGSKWTKRNIDPNIDLQSIIFGNNIFAAVGIDYSLATSYKILTSPDGAKWTEQSMGDYDYFKILAFGKDIFFGLGGINMGIEWKGKMLTSSDCSTWSEREKLPGFSAATFGKDTFIAVGGDNILQSDPYPPILSISGKGYGIVASSDGKISCGNDCTETYELNATVSLTAMPVTGFIFSGWSGGGCTGVGTCTVTMDSNKDVLANFKIPERYALKVKLINSKNGTVTSSDDGINCGNGKTDCIQRPYYEGSNTSVTLTATPKQGHTFKGWSGGGCTGTGTCSVTMAGNKTVTARFGKI